MEIGLPIAASENRALEADTGAPHLRLADGGDRAGSPIAVDVLAHLDAQLLSARRLLAQTVRQSVAMRRRDVDGVLQTMTGLQSEMASRGRLESERTELLWRAGSLLGVPPEDVTLPELEELMDESDGAEARLRSAELRELLFEVEREYAINRALLRQELAFLGHLEEMLGDVLESGSDRPPGPAMPATGRPALHLVDGGT